MLLQFGYMIFYVQPKQCYYGMHILIRDNLNLLCSECSFSLHYKDIYAYQYHGYLSITVGKGFHRHPYKFYVIGRSNEGVIFMYHFAYARYIGLEAT